jgi:DNA-directed RNA polymerase specialized sigma24 family protein
MLEGEEHNHGVGGADETPSSRLVHAYAGVAMNSIAIAGAPAPASLPADNDVVRRASRGDHDAFAEIYRRHHQPTWRLASAVAGEADLAGQAVADGFSRVLRSVRRRQARAGDPIRPLLLEATYRSAIEAQRRRAGSGPRPVAPVAVAGDATAEELVAPAAFASLPERWRGALWLHEVEGFGADEVGPILGVSAAVAGQLIERGTRALAGRFEAAHVVLPAHLGALLRPLTPAQPAGLQAAAEARWQHQVTRDTTGRFLPAAWLEERAARPLGLAATGLLALGVIGLGVVSQHTSVNSTSPYLAAGAPNPDGANGVTSLAANSSGATGPFAAVGGLFSGLANGDQVNITSTGFDYAGTSYDNSLVPRSQSASPLASGGGSGGTSGTSGSSGSSGATSGTPDGTPSSGPGTTPSGSTPASGGSGGGATTPVTSPTTLVNLGPVGSVTQTTTASGGGSTSVNVLPTGTSGTPAATVNLGTCTGANLLGLVLGCGTATTAPATAPVSTTTTVPQLLTPVNNILSPTNTTVVSPVLSSLGL